MKYTGWCENDFTTHGYFKERLTLHNGWGSVDHAFDEKSQVHTLQRNVVVYQSVLIHVQTRHTPAV